MATGGKRPEVTIGRRYNNELKEYAASSARPCHLFTFLSVEDQLQQKEACSLEQKPTLNCQQGTIASA